MAINRKTRFKIFMRDEFTCRYCGRKAPAIQLNVDHRMPVAEGGTDDEANLVTSCIECNSGKSAMLLPVTLAYEGGPLEGRTLRTTEFLPLIWVWLDVNGEHIEFPDAIDDNKDATGNCRKVKVGPSWLDQPESTWKPILDRLRFRESDGATSRLLGAYVASDSYPFSNFPTLTWMEPWQLLLDFDFNDFKRRK